MSYKETKCINGILLRPNPKFRSSLTDFDSLSCEFELGKGWERSLYAVGDEARGFNSDILSNMSKLVCDNVTVRSAAGSLRATCNFKGLLGSKRPSGGGAYFTNEEAIPTHPNYSHRPDTWAKKENVFGEGPSPNKFGRVTDENGAFKRFGPASPDMPCTMGQEPKTWACKLEGVEAYLTVGQLGYEYRVLTDHRWADNLLDDIGKVCTPRSQYIPPPDASSWLFIGMSEDIQHIGTKAFYTTTAQYLSATMGGWHPWIYQKGQQHNLDTLAKVK